MNLKTKKINKKSFNQRLNELAEETNQRKSRIFKDMVVCKKKFHITFKDYYFFDVINLNHLERKSVISKKMNNHFVLKYNIMKYGTPFIERAEFMKIFSKYINREWLILTGNNKKEFVSFCDRHSTFIAKSNKMKKQKKYKIVDIKSYKLKDLYEELMERNLTVIEENIIQNPSLNKLHAESINSIYIVTLLGSVICGYLKVGTGTSNSDNYKDGALWASIDLETGKVEEAIDAQRKIYEKHPQTNEIIKGIEIPHWQEIKKEIEELVLEIPQIGYAGYTFAVGTDSLYLFNGTATPENIFYSHPKTRTGLLPKFHQAEERKFEE